MSKPKLKLYNYFRSSASYRARLALHWKGLEFEYIPVHLVRDGGEQNSDKYRAFNPMGHVPTLVDGDFALAETVAIFDYLDREYPTKPLFPSDSKLRAHTLQVCEAINSGIQPFQNLKVLKYLEKTKGLTDAQKVEWVHAWVCPGLASLEKLVSQFAGTYAMGGEVTAADMFIVPQLFSTIRFKIDLSAYPTLKRVAEAAGHLEPFRKAHPEQQPDFEK
jgi:maleylacetoacetate isomerase